MTNHPVLPSLSPSHRPAADLPVSNRPLHMLTRSPTGLMSNTAGTTYFYPPECCEDQPYNTYAADVSALASCDVDLGAGRDAVRDGGGPSAAVQPRSDRFYGRFGGEGGRDPLELVVRVAISFTSLRESDLTAGTCFGGFWTKTRPSGSRSMRSWWR